MSTFLSILESLVSIVNFGKRVEDFGWKIFVDKEIVGNCWRIWALLDHCCLGPTKNLGDFSNRDYTWMNMNCWRAL